MKGLSTLAVMAIALGGGVDLLPSGQGGSGLPNDWFKRETRRRRPSRELPPSQELPLDGSAGAHLTERVETKGKRARRRHRAKERAARAVKEKP